MNQLSVIELSTWLADTTRKAPLLLDVREPWEVQTASMPGITHVPMNLIPARLDDVKEMAGERDIVAICHHGSRSMQVAMFLEHHGLGPVHNLSGGINAWSLQVDPAVPRY